jgi:CRP/FNR family transcriptional regulator
MMSAQPVSRLLDLYPALRRVDADWRARLFEAELQWANAPAGAVLFEEGAPCRAFPMVLSGCVRVARGSPGGRTIELYRVTPGEMCVVSTSCLFGQAALTAHGRTTEPTEIALLSPAGFERLCETADFRRYAFGAFADRLADLMALAEAVAFQRLDQRLAQTLLGRGTVVAVTHQALADELGTVREIVTRLLRRFEREGWVRLGRERVELADPGALRIVASGGDPDT